MIKNNQMAQILFTGITVNDLLFQIEQIIDAKISVTPQIPNNQSEYITRKDVAKRLKISLPTLHEWCKIGILRPYKIGARVLFKESEVIETLERVPSFKHKKGGMYAKAA